jgi:hypothetical protein
VLIAFYFYYALSLDAIDNKYDLKLLSALNTRLGQWFSIGSNVMLLLPARTLGNV